MITHDFRDTGSECRFEMLHVTRAVAEAMSHALHCIGIGLLLGDHFRAFIDLLVAKGPKNRTPYPPQWAIAAAHDSLLQNDW